MRDQGCFEIPNLLDALLINHGLKLCPQVERQGRVHFGVLADIHGRQLPHFALGVDAKVAGGFCQALFALHLAQIVIAKRVQAVAEAVFVKQVGRHHGVDHAAANVKAFGPQPSKVILRIVHDLVGTTGKLLLQPPLYDSLVEIAAAKVAGREVAGPIVGCDGIANHFPVFGWPPRPLGFDVGVARFNVNRNLFAIRQVRQLVWWHPLGVISEHRDLQFGFHSCLIYCQNVYDERLCVLFLLPQILRPRRCSRICRSMSRRGRACAATGLS